MIKNEKQYKTTKAQLSLLSEALSRPDSASQNIHPILIKAQRDSIKSQYNELYKEVEVYEFLKEGKFEKIDIDSFDMLPRGLIKARIARGLSQRELAERLGLKEQQIQKYEATEYAAASFDRLKQVINALNVKISEEIFLSNTSFNKTQLFKNLSRLGIPRELVLDKILPAQLSVKLEMFNEMAENEANNILAKITAILSRVFGLSEVALFGEADTKLNLAFVNPVRYKKSISANSEKVSAYTIYAHFLALSLFQSSKVKKQAPVPDDPEVVRQSILQNFGKINFETVLRYIWSLGIPVLALNDPGAFHGACWRIEGFNIIVLKQKTTSESRWIHDALHELCHAGQHPEQDTLEIIESDDVLSRQIEREEEDEANYFAADVQLGDNVDDVAEECILASRNNMSNLKREVTRIAQKHKMEVGGLANYIAFRLSTEQNQDWWGTANNLQVLGFSPFELCKSLIIQNCDISNLNEFDKELLIKALI